MSRIQLLLREDQSRKSNIRYMNSRCLDDSTLDHDSKPWDYLRMGLIVLSFWLGGLLIEIGCDCLQELSALVAKVYQAIGQPAVLPADICLR